MGVAMIPLNHLTEDDYYDKGASISTDHFINQAGIKIKAASDRKAALSEAVEDVDFAQLRTQLEHVKEQRKVKATSKSTSVELTAAQETAIDTLIELNTKLVRLSKKAARQKLITGEGYDLGAVPNRTVKNWEALASTRLEQAKRDQPHLAAMGLGKTKTQALLDDYAKALKSLTEKDQTQESNKPDPERATRELIVARGKLAYMVLWLCSVAEEAFEDEPEVARLFQINTLLRARALTPSDPTGEAAKTEVPQ
jgi:hypothetical protein